MSVKPFYVGTCEAISNDEKKIAFDPSTNQLTPFPIQDPFGLRKAIVPVFRRNLNGDVFGMGTAFHIDGWGTFLTAYHVIDFAMKSSYLPNKEGISLHPTDEHPLLFLGMGLAYGTPTIPEEAFAVVNYMAQAMHKKNDPLAEIIGKSRIENSIDLSAMNATFKPKTVIPHFVPVRALNWQPIIGETVLAVGFSELNCKQSSPSKLEFLLSEGMYGAYGIIRDIHPEGTSSSNPTPDALHGTMR